MKILHVIPSISLAHGGPSHAIRSMERVLTRLGVEVETLTTDDDGPGAHNGKKLGVPLKENGVVRRYFRKRLEFYKIAPGLAYWLGQHVHEYDVVHIHALFSFSGVAAARAAQQAGVPYVIRPLGTLTRYGVGQRRPWLKRLSLKFIEAPMLRQAAAVHFTAEAEQREAEALGIFMNSVVIPLGVELDPSTASQENRANGFLKLYPQSAGARLVLYLSRLDPKKNVEGLLRAFALLLESERDDAPTRLAEQVWDETGNANNRLMLVIAGEGEPDYVASLHALARELGLNERVLWVGQLAGDAKAGVLAAASVFVLPSFSENFGIAAAEALLAGLPCVLGEGVAIAREVEQAGAGLVVKPEPQSIAVALQTLMNDDTMRTSMSGYAAELARSRFSLDAMGGGLLELYGSILSGHTVEHSRGQD